MKIALDGTLGQDFVDCGGGGRRTTAFSTSLRAGYQASPLRGDEPFGPLLDQRRSLHGGRFPQYNLDSGRDSASSTGPPSNAGIGYEMNSREIFNGDRTESNRGRGARDYLTSDTSIGMPIYRDHILAFTFFSWSEAMAEDRTVRKAIRAGSDF